MNTTAEIGAEANRVLAEIKSGVGSARIVELQRQYRQLCRRYEQAARAAWAMAPLNPA
jgi:hypothetical protein